MIFLRIFFLIIFFISGAFISHTLNLGNIISVESLFVGIALSLIAWGIEFLFINVPKKRLFLTTIGLIVGILLSKYIMAITVSLMRALDLPQHKFMMITNSARLFIGVLIVYLSIVFILKKLPELADVLDYLREGKITEGAPKIIDTSVVIDGRIHDIFKTEFIEGKIIIARFILEELQQIADSSDSLKRGRGRRGLDILNRMQTELEDRVEIVDDDYYDIKEIDSKLVKLAQDRRGMLLTNDYNLNKIAELQKVKVLNINELSNALKPVVAPGEDMKIRIMKEGKDPGQGVGYLQDGTMVVVEHGKRFIGKEVRVSVTSLHQTPAGRMIFTKMKER